MTWSLRETRDAIGGAADRLADAAEDTKMAMTALALVGAAALAVALVALAVAMRGRQA